MQKDADKLTNLKMVMENIFELWEGVFIKSPALVFAKCYRIWQKQAEVADYKTAEIGLNSIQV